MSIQKGQKPASIKESKDPLLQRDNQYQAETGNPRGFRIDMGGKMPNIEYTTKQSGVIGQGNPVTVKPLREPIAEPTLNNPDVNQHDQFVNPNAIEHSPGAFNN